MSPLVVLALWLAWQNQAAEKCSVSGTVVDAVTQQALAKADVSLEPLSGKRDGVAVTPSDAEGKFAMTDLEPGRYRLKAKRSRYLESAYGARRPDGEGSIVRLEAGQAMSGLEIRLTPTAAIAGTVRESDGEPLEDAHVMLARYTYEHGRPQLRGVDSTDTDDRGEYRFRGLAPGKYYIGVEPKSHGWNRIDRSASAGLREESLPTFYPGVREASMATPVVVTAGRVVQGIDVTLLRSRVYRVGGSVLNAPAGSRLTVVLHDAKNAAVQDYDLRTPTKNAAGEFEFRNVPPGTYELMVRHESLRGLATVAVDASDVENVRVTMAPGADVRLRLSAKGPDKPDTAKLDYFLTIDGSSGFGPYGGGDRLMSHNVPPGLYTLKLGGSLLREYYVAQARSTDADVLADGLRVAGPGLIEIEVAVGKDGAAAEGVVLDKDQRPVSGATVLLAPNGRARFDLFRSTTTDQNGRYEFSMVPPADYKLFAWDDVEKGAWNDPEFLAPYEDQGEKVALGPNGRASKSLQLAARP